MISVTNELLVTWSDYHDFVRKEFMWDFDNKDILEIGSFTGHQTQIIDRYNFKSLTLVEPNADAVQELSEKYPRAKIIQGDIFEIYADYELRCDTVVCLGLLYHLHSPLYLLETIVNRSNPKTIILDSIHCKLIGQSGLVPEPINIPGNMHTNRKAVSRSVSFPFPDIDIALNELGYRQHRYQDLDKFNISAKQYSWMARWEAM